jgi:hypothetical protein
MERILTQRHYAVCMTEGNLPERLAAEVAETVRRILGEAEARASEIVRDAESEATGMREQAESDASQIRDRAEADARAQIDAARKALDDLGGSLAAAVSEAPVSPSRAKEPEPEPQPEPTELPESPGAPETPVSPPAPEQAAASPPNGDDAAERLVAMKLAVEGKDPSAIEMELVEKFGPGDRTALLKEVLARLPR